MKEIGGNTRSLRDSVDWKLVICYLVLVLIGWVNIYAAVHSSEPSSIFDWSCRSGKQAVWILTAFLLDFLILFVINPRMWEVISTPAYLAVVWYIGVRYRYRGFVLPPRHNLYAHNGFFFLLAKIPLLFY